MHPPSTTPTAEESCPRVDAAAPAAERFEAVRRTTEWLCAPLSPEDAVVQSMPDASPAKWHLAHTTWFFETFLLSREPGYETSHPEYRVLFNSYYHAVGERHPRPQRGLITRPGLAQVRGYRRRVDEAMRDWFGRHADDREALAVAEIGLHHEQQHQELILMDAKHLFSCNPLLPAYRSAVEGARIEPAPVGWRPFEAGVREIGHGGTGFAYDNEQPRHRVFVGAFELADRLVTNGEYLEFIEDGGYRRPELWLDDGWTRVCEARWSQPAYWHEVDGSRRLFTLGGARALRTDEPVCHVSYYEADAYARWAGARLATEAEWETAADEHRPGPGNFLESGRMHPVPAGTAGHPRDQMFGDLWEWTASPYVPYPGYTPPPGALGEYNGKFMCNQMVLRGGCCATPASHFRPTYRNFFYPHQRWQFAGIRLAR